MKAPRVITQGRAVVEFNDGDFLLMTPDGEITVHGDKASVQRKVNRWNREHADAGAINILEVEWR